MANIVGRYFSFEGRLARLPFFGRGFYLGVVTAALAMVSIPFFSREGLWWWFGIPIVIASLVLLAVGSFSLIIRRLCAASAIGWSRRQHEMASSACNTVTFTAWAFTAA